MKESKYHEILRTIKLLADHGGAFEVRGFECWGKYPQVEVFQPGEWESAAEFTLWLSEPGEHRYYQQKILHRPPDQIGPPPMARGRYIVLNPVKPEAYDRSIERAWDKAAGLQVDKAGVDTGDILSRRWLLVDVDLMKAEADKD